MSIWYSHSHGEQLHLLGLETQANINTLLHNMKINYSNSALYTSEFELLSLAKSRSIISLLQYSLLSLTCGSSTDYCFFCIFDNVQVQ